MITLQIIQILIAFICLEAVITLTKIFVLSFKIKKGEVIEIPNKLINHFGIYLALYYNEDGEMGIVWAKIKEK